MDQDLTHHLWDSIKGSYKILKFIGKGSYGQVVKARCLKSNQSVVIKLINNVDQSPKLMKRTLREIKILGELSKVQNNIFTARLIDVFTTDLEKH